MNLFIAPFDGGFSLVKALESAIMTFIQTPRIEFWKIGFAEGFKSQIHRAVCPLENRGEGDIEGITFFAEEFASFLSFPNALL